MNKRMILNSITLAINVEYYDYFTTELHKQVNKSSKEKADGTAISG